MENENNPSTKLDRYHSTKDDGAGVVYHLMEGYRIRPPQQDTGTETIHIERGFPPELSEISTDDDDDDDDDDGGDDDDDDDEEEEGGGGESLISE
ncbi:unnamed protein product [Schistocephalus solidus]|uniref:Uncharacterized protein n=1 Tax=Schistocephalus solidus TaxID=70667 RepID=A0A183SK21_SCHSO|nr:unnamed protein product [Schistocephalus solidus]